ncbi:acylphosphatase [Streptomyces albus subsp. albus]|nr:acylphosphatase [Streptomyces albus subsp. albus]
MTVRQRIVVTGVVQGVFFRDTCQRTAWELGVSGWVRNLPGGEVEAVFEGDEDAVGAMVQWAGQGPPAARVERVEVTDEEPEGLESFEVRSSPRG